MKEHEANNPVVWTGDLADDCSAEWCGLLLRAEWTDENYWWWTVTDIATDVQIKSSNDHTERVIGGEAARKKAEDAAMRYLGV